jgi:hypothetical protein
MYGQQDTPLSLGISQFDVYLWIENISENVNGKDYLRYISKNEIMSTC